MSFPAVRHSFDTVMFRGIWGPSVHALGVVLEHADSEGTAGAALQGLQLAARWVLFESQSLALCVCVCCGRGGGVWGSRACSWRHIGCSDVGCMCTLTRGGGNAGQ